MTASRDDPGSTSPTDPTEGFTRLTRLVGRVAAPITLVTALMVYFGWVSTGGTFDVFGIDRSVLGFSTQDYLLRSLNATFKPLTALLLASLVLVPGHAALVRFLRPRRRAAHAVCWTIAALGLVVVGCGMLGLLGLAAYPGSFPVTPIGLGLGVLSIGYASVLAQMTELRPRLQRAEPPIAFEILPRVAAAAVVVLTLFWSVAVFAQAHGRAVARSLVVESRSLPQITIFAEERLHLDGPGVREAELTGAEARYRFRYDGLRLLVRSNDRLFMLPTPWRPGGHAIVLPDDPTLRIELFRRP